MIKKQYLFPECYINKVACCDDCEVPLDMTNTQLLSDPPKQVMKCPKCNKEYYIDMNQIKGEWKWRTI